MLRWRLAVAAGAAMNLVRAWCDGSVCVNAPALGCGGRRLYAGAIASGPALLQTDHESRRFALDEPGVS
jgi:hypothetical protein